MDHRAAVVVLGVAMLTAACSPGGPPPGTIASPPPGGVVGPAVVQSDPGAHLVDPASGATGVPANVGSIAFVVTLAALRSGGVTLAPATQGTSVIAVAGITTDAGGVSHVAVPL